MITFKVKGQDHRIKNELKSHDGPKYFVIGHWLCIHKDYTYIIIHKNVTTIFFKNKGQGHSAKVVILQMAKFRKNIRFFIMTVEFNMHIYKVNHKEQHVTMVFICVIKTNLNHTVIDRLRR